MAKTIKEKKEISLEEITYQNYPSPGSRPENLATLGKLFGMTPPNVENAKILEICCGNGSNIIPHASNFPKGKYVGVDLSKDQIKQGTEQIKSMGLKNIELKNCSIADIDKSFGKFDYIICHNAISKVSDDDRKKILEVANQNLTENGIVYISYNTLPGWNMVNTVRDMMQYHSKRFKSAGDKISQAGALLKFVKDSLNGTDTPYAKMLSQEAEILSQQDIGYFSSNYLADQNKQFYFSDFVDEAAKNDLQYLSDTSLASMYLGNMKPEIVEKLKELNDIVSTEQYMDFITNRRFRSTLLCHKNVKLRRNLSNDIAREFALSFNVVTEKPLDKVNLDSDEKLNFYYQANKNQSLSTNSPELKAIFYTFIENKGYPLKFDTIVEQANKKFKNDRKSQIEKDLHSNIMNLIIKGYVDISLFERDKGKVNLDKPSLTKLANYQLNYTNNNWITNSSHRAIGINVLDKILLRHMNGKNITEEILDLCAEDMKKSGMALNKDDKKIEDFSKVKQELSVHLDQLIQQFSTQGIFE